MDLRNHPSLSTHLGDPIHYGPQYYPCFLWPEHRQIVISRPLYTYRTGAVKTVYRNVELPFSKKEFWSSFFTKQTVWLLVIDSGALNNQTQREREREMTELVKLPIVDLSSPDRSSTAGIVLQACREHGFFYLVNHGVEEELLEKVFSESKKLFALALEEKMKLGRKNHRGYTPLFAESLDPDSGSKGDPKESYYIGPSEDDSTSVKLNQWPSQEILPSWRPTMEIFYRKVMCAGKRLLCLIALALNLDENFFERVGGLDKPTAYLRLLHYPGEIGFSNEEICGASAHSDYGMITLLASDGVRGLQICKEKFKQPRVWEDVLHLDGAFIVNIGDMMERWTNCLFRSTLHRVIPVGQDRYSAAFFLDPKQDCLVECLESCCSESCPPRFPPILSGDYLKERLRLTYGLGLESIGAK